MILIIGDDVEIILTVIAVLAFMTAGLWIFRRELLNKFYGDLKSVLTKEKLKENLKLPVYSYIASYILGAIALIVITVLKPDIPKETITPEKFGMGTTMTWSLIITNNLKVMVGLFISGIVLYIGPLIIIGLNGFVHGLLLVAYIHAAGGKGMVDYFILMVPHGIFELPALFLSAGAGIILSRELLNFITLRWINKSKLYEAFLILFVAFCLFIVASIIETQFTSRIQQL